MSTSSRMLLAAAAAAAAFEVALAPFMEAPLVALAFAALFAAGALWLHRRPGLAPPIVLGLLFLIELLGLPTYERDSAADWVTQSAFGALSVFGVVAAIRLLAQRRVAAASRGSHTAART